MRVKKLILLIICVIMVAIISVILYLGFKPVANCSGEIISIEGSFKFEIVSGNELRIYDNLDNEKTVSLSFGEHIKLNLLMYHISKTQPVQLPEMDDAPIMSFKFNNESVYQTLVGHSYSILIKHILSKEINFKYYYDMEIKTGYVNLSLSTIAHFILNEYKNE